MIGFDFNERPFVVIWEVTRACGLVCRHCRAAAKVNRHPLELTPEEGFRFIDQVARANPPLFILTGGDPVRRPDLEALVEYVKTTEGHHYRRVVLQQEELLGGRDPVAAPQAGMIPGPLSGFGLKARAPLGINDGKGFVFVSHIGEINPSGFLPLTPGNVRTHELLEVYRNSAVFRELRDSSLLKGKCGRCEYKDLCGGSRARAYALSGDYLAEEPLCVYEPGSGPTLMKPAPCATVTA